MKQVLKLSLLLLFHFCTKAQEKDTIRRWFDENLKMVNRNQASFGGLQVKSDDHWLLLVVYPDTNLLLKAYFKDRNLQTKDGPFYLYHAKGVKAIQGTYVDNTKQGVWRYWYESGKLKDSGLLKNNQMTGQWASWSTDGTLLSLGEYTQENEILEHSTPPYESNSKSLISDEDIFRSRDGSWKVYYSNGQLKELGFYKKEIKEGPWQSWYETGQPEAKGNFLKNVMEGEWVFFRENGQMSTREQYKNNKVSSLECFDENGKAQGDFCSLSKPPVPALDRFTDFKTYMLDNIFWPKELDGKDVNGIVKISFTITKDGIMSNLKILESPHDLLSKETIRFFNSIAKWYPAMSHNRAIDYSVDMEIPFLR